MVFGDCSTSFCSSSGLERVTFSAPSSLARIHAEVMKNKTSATITPIINQFMSVSVVVGSLARGCCVGGSFYGVVEGVDCWSMLL